MEFIIEHRWGRSERSTEPRAIGALLAEFDEKDDEHVSVCVRLASGWCLSAYSSGLLVYENVEDLGAEPRHLHAQTRETVRRVMGLLAQGNLTDVDREDWRAGNGV